MSTTCPFCVSNIPDRASVCRGCGAYLSSPLAKNAMGALFLLFLWGNYALFGPFAIYAGLFLENNRKEGMAMAIFGLAVTIVGFYLLRKLTKWYARPLWYRR